jgi:uncharacterized membrane protein
MGLMNKYWMILFLFFLLIPIINAEDYYADIEITVDNAGFVTINGITNHQDLLVNDTELYTSKNQSYWLLNITKDDVFSDFIFSISFPDSSSINYVKTSGFMRIEEDEGKLIVSGYGQNKTLSLIVQYQVDKLINKGIVNNLLFYISIIIILIIFILIVIFYFLRNYKFKVDDKEKDLSEYNNLKGLNERQKKIINLLIEKDRPLSQTIIQQELNIPKSAVSRNISSLELKGIIEKENIGMSNLIRLKKP